MKTIPCWLCGNHLPTDTSPGSGVLSNRKNSIRSDLILAAEQIRRLNVKIPEERALKAKLEQRIASLEAELAQLEDRTPQPSTPPSTPPPFYPTPKVTIMSDTTATEPAPPPAEEAIEFTDFTKVSLRVGIIRSAERVPKSDKLIKMTVDFGDLGERTILAGIGKTYEPQHIINLQAVFVTNLKPRKMMGIESHGMMLAIGESDQLALLTPTRGISAGAKVG